MIDHRIRTIRFWLLTVAICGGCISNPGLAVYFLATYAMAPLGLFMPVFGTSSVTCTRCDGNSAPSQLQIDISGVANAAPGHCSNCDCLNSSYTLDFVSDSVGGYCYWQLSFPPCDTDCPACGIGQGNNTHTIFLFVNDSGDVEVQLVDVENVSSFVAIQYESALGADPDCSAWAAENIPHSASNVILCGGNFYKPCEGSASTCEVTSL